MHRPQPSTPADTHRPPAADGEVTRLAPSPTGALHLGNARTFLINWALAKQNGWRIVLRIEDLDWPRNKTDADRQAIDILTWLGLNWHEGPVYQAHDLTPYHQVLSRLLDRDEVYPCTCTRKDLQNAQSAPHGDEHELCYPGTCRPPKPTKPGESGEPAQSGEPPHHRDDLLAESNAAWRLVVPDEPIEFEDQLHGPQLVDVYRQVGDFIVASKAGLPAYQLAVVVDDARQGVTQVVRGDDLLGSTGRQLLLYRMLGLGPVPTYTHVPLVLGPDGRRLAKRHGDTRVSSLRQQGVTAQKIVGLIAWWSGVSDRRTEMDAGEFAQRFDLGRLSKNPVTFTQEDQAWLIDGG